MLKPEKGHKFIGLSLSRYISEIASGEISLKDIEVIITSTEYRNEQEFEHYLNTSYCTIWYNNYDHQVAIARKL